MAESPYPRPRSGQNPCPKPSPTSGNLSKTLPPAHVTVTASGVRRNGLPLEPVTYDLHSAKTTYLTGYFRTRRLTRRPTSARGRAGPVLRSPEIRPVREYGPRRSVDGRGSCVFVCGESPPPRGGSDPSKEREETTQNDRRGIDSDAAQAARARHSVLASPTTYPGARRLTLRLTIGAGDLKTGYFFRYVEPALRNSGRRVKTRCY